MSYFELLKDKYKYSDARQLKIEKELQEKWYLTYYDICKLLKIDYDERINHLLMLYNSGIISWDGFCENLETIRRNKICK